MNEVCEWCKGPVLMMYMKGEGVCSPQCGYYAAHILFEKKAKQNKFAKWLTLGHPKKF